MTEHFSVVEGAIQTLENFRTLFQHKEQLPDTKRGNMLAAITAGVVAACAASPVYAAEQGNKNKVASHELQQSNEKDSPREYVDVGEREGYYVSASAESLMEIKKQNRREDNNKFDLHFSTHGFEGIKTIDPLKDIIDPSRYGLADLKFFHPATNEAHLDVEENNGKKLFKLFIQDDDGSKTTAYISLDGTLLKIE